MMKDTRFGIFDLDALAPRNAVWQVTSQGQGAAHAGHCGNVYLSPKGRASDFTGTRPSSIQTSNIPEWGAGWPAGHHSDVVEGETRHCHGTLVYTPRARDSQCKMYGQSPTWLHLFGLLRPGWYHVSH